MTTKAPVRIAVNGFGRIGRSLLRVLLDNPKLQVVHINDPMTTEQAAYLLQYDTVMGRLDRVVVGDATGLKVGDRHIAMTHHPLACELEWKDLGVDYVVNSSGVNNDRKNLEALLERGVRRVFISAPAPAVADRHVFVGLNSNELTQSDRIVSGGSCTAHCFAPIIKILAAHCTIERGFLQTVHSYTSAQNLIDGAHSRDLRRGRAAAQNIVPTTTEAVKAFEAAMPEMQGLLKGMAMRVPVANGSNIDLVLQLSEEKSRDDINQVLRRAAESDYRGIVEFSQAELVSSDIVGNPHSCVIDSALTQAHGPLLRLFLWYDNEWGYANRFAELIALAADQDQI